MVNADIEIKEQKNEVKVCDILLHNRYYPLLSTFDMSIQLDFIVTHSMQLFHLKRGQLL